MELMLRKTYINILQSKWLLCTFLFVIVSTKAEEIKLGSKEKVTFEAAITEADIIPSFTKFPNKRWENIQPEQQYYQSPYQIALFSSSSGEDSDRLWSQTKSIFAYGFGVIGVISLLPEGISNWEKDEGVVNKWSDNVKDGPVWDRDNATLNLIGHPYFGGVYYQVARKSGYRQWDSFIYSAMMSTFYWEYGIEAFAETPSIQDIVITPVLGWAYGEWAFTTEMNIRANNNKVLGSSFLGSTALILLDPVDSLNVGINNLFGKEIIKAGTSYIGIKEVPIDANGTTESQIQFNVALQLGDGRKYSSTNNNYSSDIKDPIDTGIIGISLGKGALALDEYWQLEDDDIAEYSLGLYFSKKFSARLSYAKTELASQHSGSNNKIAYENYSLDGQYYLNNQGKLRPFITAGFGEMIWEKDNELKTFQVNVGTGLHYKLTNNISVQLDWRHYVSTSTKTSENTMASRVIYRFGAGEH